MPLGEIAGEMVGGLLRIIGQIFAEIVFELLIKGAGYLICRPFNRAINPDGSVVVIVGIAFWIAFGGVGYVSYKAFVV